MKLKVLVAQSCLTLCNPMPCSSSGSSVDGILQVRILEWVAISFPRGSSWPRDWTHVSCIAGRFFTVWATGKVPQSYTKKVSWSMWNPRFDSLYFSLISMVEKREWVHDTTAPETCTTSQLAVMQGYQLLYCLSSLECLSLVPQSILCHPSQAGRVQSPSSHHHTKS